MLLLLLERLKMASIWIKIIVCMVLIGIIGMISYNGLIYLEIWIQEFWNKEKDISYYYYYFLFFKDIFIYYGKQISEYSPWMIQGIFFTGFGIFLHYSYSRVLGNRNNSNSSNLDEIDSSQSDELRSATYPSQYPNGWYFLVYSKDLKKGQVKNVNALGQQLVVFRGESGAVGVLDAFCPHLGANLGVGGKVCGDMIECPFHKWKFGVDGECKVIPYSDKNIPNNANTNAWPCVEYCDMICIYYHCQRKPPCYTLPVQPDISNGQLVYRGSMDAGIIHMHIQEFAENAADWMHFDPVHGRMMIPFTRYEIPLIWRWLQIHHTPGTVLGKEPEAIKYGPNDPHFMYFLDQAHLNWKGKEIPNTKALAVITFCGPAGICYFRFSVPNMGDIVLFHTHLPSGNMKLRVRFHWYADKNMPRVLVWYVVGLWISQWTNDIDIWENKVHFKRPCIVAGDGPINRVRAWYKQFYSGQEKKTHEPIRKNSLSEEKLQWIENTEW